MNEIGFSQDERLAARVTRESPTRSRSHSAPLGPTHQAIIMLCVCVPRTETRRRGRRRGSRRGSGCSMSSIAACSLSDLLNRNFPRSWQRHLWRSGLAPAPPGGGAGPGIPPVSMATIAVKCCAFAGPCYYSILPGGGRSSRLLGAMPPSSGWGRQRLGRARAAIENMTDLGV